MSSYRPYCPRCLVGLGPIRALVKTAETAASVHATVTGHVAQVVDLIDGRVVLVVAGEPSLPLWDDPQEGSEGPPGG